MHISLDSALGRQRRLNSVGESVLQIAPNAAAAYSLRSLTGGSPKVVRVRRASDNGERDFTSAEINSGEMVSWVNQQTIAPLDIQALEADGRTGDFLIAKAAYSLRSLGTRQATLAATGDTVSRADGKFVVQVRRSLDDTVKSFTATEVTDGTLVNFVTQEVEGYKNNPSYIKYFGTGGISNVTTTSFDIDAGSNGLYVFALGSGQVIEFGVGDIVEVNLSVTGLTTSGRLFLYKTDSGSTASGSAHTFSNGDNQTVSAVATAAGGQIGFGTLRSPDGGSITINSVKVTGQSGFVKTWYDQSVTNEAGDTATGNHATQATAASQPKIVSAGALETDSSGNPALVGDGTDDTLFNSTLTTELDNSDFLVTAAYKDELAMGITGAVPRFYLTSSSMSYDTLGTITYSPQTGKKILSFQVVGDTQEVFGNGTSLGTASQAQANIGQSLFGVMQGGSSVSSGPLMEVIVYNTNQSANRTALEANIGEAYSISGIPAYDNEVDGFVETWYDQSGNNRPLIQTTASEQPLIVEDGVFLNGVKANKATSNDTMQNLQVSTDGTNADFGTDDWASGASSKLGAVYVGTVPADSVVTPASRAVIWGGGRGVGSFQEGGVSLQVIKGGTDTWRIMNERQGLSPSTMENITSLNTDADVVLYGTTDNREFTINVNGSGDTETESADLDVRENVALSLFGAYDKSGNRYYQRSSGGVCKECYLYAGDPVSNIPALATSINAHYSIY